MPAWAAQSGCRGWYAATWVNGERRPTQSGQPSVSARTQKHEAADHRHGTDQA